MIHKPTRREVLKYAGVAALTFGVPLLLPKRAWALTATIGNNTGNTYSGTSDTELGEAAPTTNTSTAGTLLVSTYGTGDRRKALVKFGGLTNITGPVTVSAATFYLYLYTVSASLDTTDLRRIIPNWVSAQATWNVYATATNWPGSAGCSTNGTDRSSTLSATRVVNDFDNNSYQAWTSAQLIADVQDMINNPSTNYGWVVEKSVGTNDGNYKGYQTSEGTNAQRPYLDITYTAGGGGGGGVSGVAHRRIQ